jgi:hypothetical protein
MNRHDQRSLKLAGTNCEKKVSGFFGHVTRQVSGAREGEAVEKLKPP